MIQHFTVVFSTFGSVYQVLLLCLSISSTAAAFDEIGEPSKRLMPMEKPNEKSVGSKKVFQNNLKGGVTGHFVVTGKSERAITWTYANGCSTTQSTLFHLPTKWEGCGRNGQVSGSQKVQLVGEIWPLSEGRKFKFLVTNGRDSKGNAWNDSVTCEVERQVRIQTSAGEFDTFKTVCRGKWETHIRYIAPEVKTQIAYKRMGKNGEIQADSEWLRWE